MATIKVKFRKSTKNDNTVSIYYQLCHNGEVRQVRSGIHMSESLWDATTERPVESSDNEEENKKLHDYRLKINGDFARFKDIFNDLGNSQGNYTLSDVIKAFNNPAPRTTVLTFMAELIETLQRNRRFGTAYNYRSTKNSFRDFLNNKDIAFSQITERLITEYEQWLFDRGVVRNSSSFYLRILRSTYNKAVKQKLTRQNNPFDNVYTGVDSTRKRALDENVILKLMKLELKTEGQRQARDLFIFSYCTRGMTFVDIAHLKKTDLSNGVLSYVRRKTGQRLTIKVEPVAQGIINHYSELTEGSPYIFPIISNTDPEKAFAQYHGKLGRHNKMLKELSKLLGEELPISSYWARHSWANCARNKNVPMSVISAGMGHTSEKTTQIYLDSLDNSVIDKANSDILRPLNELNLY